MNRAAPIPRRSSRRARSLAAALAVAVLFGAPGPRRASAAIDSPTVRVGLAAYEALDYPRAIAALERARGERLTVEELVATLRTLGFARAALGDEPGARREFERLLGVAPGLTLDSSVSPRIRRLFDEARAKLPPAPVPPPAVAPAPAPAPEVTATTRAAPRRPVYRRAWFWGVLGGVVAAGVVAGVTAGVLTRDPGGTLTVIPR